MIFKIPVRWFLKIVCFFVICSISFCWTIHINSNTFQPIVDNVEFKRPNWMALSNMCSIQVQLKLQFSAYLIILDISPVWNGGVQGHISHGLFKLWQKSSWLLRVIDVWHPLFIKPLTATNLKFQTISMPVSEHIHIEGRLLKIFNKPSETSMSWWKYQTDSVMHSYSISRCTMK